MICVSVSPKKNVVGGGGPRPSSNACLLTESQVSSYFGDDTARLDARQEDIRGFEVCRLMSGMPILPRCQDADALITCVHIIQAAQNVAPGQRFPQNRLDDGVGAHVTRPVLHLGKSGVQPFQRDSAAVVNHHHLVHLPEARSRRDAGEVITLAFAGQVFRGSFIAGQGFFDQSPLGGGLS